MGSPVKPSLGVLGRLSRFMTGAVDSEAPFRMPQGVTGGNSFEAAGQGRRLRGFNPSKNHVNVAIQRAGPTLVARSRWLYANNGYAAAAVDEWVSAAVGDGIKPRPRSAKDSTRRALLGLFFDWTDEADAEGMTDFYGLQATAARETFLAGEVFARMRSRRAGDMLTVPFQVQILPSEMLDPSYDVALPGGNYIRAGIEFDAIGRRVAYHFWRDHPYDSKRGQRSAMNDRVRVDAADVIHVMDGGQSGQIRGVPRLARALVKLFTLDTYDDAELERKKTASMFAGFLIGRGENPLEPVNDDEDPDGGFDDIDGTIAGMQPGAIVDLGDDKDIKFGTPVDVGGNYDIFQYRTLLQIFAALGIPYSYGSGDVTKGNFSNVRTDIIRFRRRISQWQNHTLIFQFCRPIWRRFVDLAVLNDSVKAPNHQFRPLELWSTEWLPPRQEWIDPAKDAKAEKEAVLGGFKSRTQVVAERGYDVEAVDDEIEAERKREADKGLVFDSNAEHTAPNAGEDPAEPEDDDEDGPKKPEDVKNEA